MLLPDPRTMRPLPRRQCEAVDNDIRCIVMIPEDKPSGQCHFHEKTRRLEREWDALVG